MSKPKDISHITYNQVLEAKKALDSAYGKRAGIYQSGWKQSLLKRVESTGAKCTDTIISRVLSNELIRPDIRAIIIEMYNELKK